MKTFSVKPDVLLMGTLLYCGAMFQILIGSLLETTCNFQFKFSRASCQVPVFDIPVLKVIIPPLFQRSRK